ncbi:TPA: acetylornithine deacetylase, partial [Klebsiella pneumoniae]
MNSDLKRILATLLAFDTTSRESNLQLINYIDEYLRGYGITTRLFFDEGGKKANLYARFGPQGPGGVMLS